MAKKTIFTDIESTGLSYKTYDIIQFSIIIDIDKEIKDVLNLNVRPFNLVYEPEALKVNGLNWEDVLQFEDPAKAYKQVVELFHEYMPYEERELYDPRDKFNICAYNSKFDIPFWDMFFRKNGDNRFSRFYDKIIDPYYFLAQQKLLAKTVGYKFPLKSLKLTSVCEHFGIATDGAHTADADTLMLRDLLYKLGKVYKDFKF